MSLNYWEKRQAQKMFEAMGKAEMTADEIAKLYYKASKWLDYEMQDIFERYQSKHKLTEKEAYKLLNQLNNKSSIQEVKQALAGATDIPRSQQVLAELESPTYAYRIERLQQIQQELDLFMKNVYEQEKDYNTEHYINLASDTYYKTIFDIQRRTGLAFSFTTLDTKAVERVIHSKWSGENYSKRIWRNTKALAQDVKEELIINMLTGQTNQEAANIIANKFAQSASNARRLIRTESCYISNQMEMESYKECGIETYIFLATLDLKTSVVCQELDGKRFPVKEQMPGVNCPPMHPWCRSTTICNISNKELQKMKRRAYDPKIGRTRLVSSSMNYKEWYKKYVDHNESK